MRDRDPSAVEAAAPVDLVDARIRAREVHEWQEHHDGSNEDVSEHALMMNHVVDQRQSGKSAG
jgi:hypothetical protein